MKVLIALEWPVKSLNKKETLGPTMVKQSGHLNQAQVHQHFMDCLYI